MYTLRRLVLRQLEYRSQAREILFSFVPCAPCFGPVGQSHDTISSFQAFFLQQRITYWAMEPAMAYGSVKALTAMNEIVLVIFTDDADVVWIPCSPSWYLLFYMHFSCEDDNSECVSVAASSTSVLWRSCYVIPAICFRLCWRNYEWLMFYLAYFIYSLQCHPNQYVPQGIA